MRVGDVDLAYRSIGHGEPVVMIMGLGGTMDAWLPQLVGRIGGGRRIVVFDNRGTGRSSAGIKPITVRTMAGDTHGLIRRLKLEHPDVLGWSMGGFIAQRLDLDHPRDVDRLVLAATTGGGPGSTRPDPDAVATLLGGGPAALLGLLFPLPAEQAASDAYIASITRWSEFSLSVPSDVLSAQLAASAQWFAHGPNLKRINVPTLRRDAGLGPGRATGGLGGHAGFFTGSSTFLHFGRTIRPKDSHVVRAVQDDRPRRAEVPL
ncbi:MAG: alpha/beta fold hydrolase [Solirubrobacteraceae bacterium]